MRSIRLVLLASAPLLVALPATAQWFDGPRGYYGAPPPPAFGYYDDRYGAPVARILSRDRIVERLEDLGFEDVGRPRLEGDVYTVTAVDPSGRRIRVAVDAFRGTVLRRVGLGAPDWLDDEGTGPRRRPGPSPYDEMPGAPRFRDPPDAIARIEPAPSVTPRLAPAAPVDRQPISPPPSARAPPADPRLAPDASAARPAEPRPAETPRSEAAKPDLGPQPATATRPPTSGPLYGTNPEGGRSTAQRPAETTRPTVRPPAAAATSPAAPAPGIVAPKPTEVAPVATTAEGPRKPVRVIQGVTPLNSGGAQATPAPQNNEAATPSQ